MSIFDSKRVIQVGTSVSRVIPDDQLPTAAKTGVLRSIFQDGDMADHMLEEMIHSVAIKADRYYEYGATTYTHGLPTGEVHAATQGREEAEVVINAIEPASVLIDYSYFGPPNALHIGWMKLIQLHGYNPATNILTGISPAGFTSPTYLMDLQVVVPTAQMNTMAAGSLEQWGVPAKHGYTPERPGHAGPMGLLVAHSPVLSSDVAAEIHVLATYTWHGPGFYLIEDTAWPTNNAVHTATVVITLAGYIETDDYFHVKYQTPDIGGVTKYWMYKAGIGTWPALDAVFDDPEEVFGEFFPFAYFRYEKVSEGDNTASADYVTTKKLVKYLGMDYADVLAAIEENPDIDDVEQAMLMLAVPANTVNAMERRYLFDFFDRLFYASGEQFASPIVAGITISGQPWNSDITKGTIIIQDARFKMALSNAGIYKKRFAGTIGTGEIDQMDSGIISETVNQTYLEYGGDGTPIIVPTVIKTHWYRKQISHGIYDQVSVVKLKMLYSVYETYTTTGDDEDDILLIPLDHVITEAYTFQQREELYSRSLHFVFNSMVVTYVKWYQQEWFADFLLIVAVVLTLWSMGGDGGLFVSLATTASFYAAAILILEQILISIIISYAIKLFVKTVGLEIALVIAVLAAMSGTYLSMQTTAVTGSPWAKDLIALSTGLSKGMGDELKGMMSDLLDEEATFKDFAADQMELLEDSQKELEMNSALKPLIVFGEAPTDFFNRTIHTGNIGILCFDALHNYVDIALKLPKAEDNIGQSNVIS